MGQLNFRKNGTLFHIFWILIDELFFNHVIVDNNFCLFSVKSDSIHFCSKSLSIFPNLGPEKYSAKSEDLIGNSTADPSFI